MALVIAAHALLAPLCFVVTPRVFAFDDDGFGGGAPGRDVARGAGGGVSFCPIEIPVGAPGVRIDEEFVGIEAVALFVTVGDEPLGRSRFERRVIGPVGPPGDISVMLPDADAGDINRPEIRALLTGHGETHGGKVGFGIVKEQDFNARRVFGVHDKVDALVDNRRPHIIFEGFCVELCV